MADNTNEIMRILGSLEAGQTAMMKRLDDYIPNAQRIHEDLGKRVAILEEQRQFTAGQVAGVSFLGAGAVSLAWTWISAKLQL
jgi:hypothetical protein